MEYFVTGSTGLIGSHVVTELLATGHDVVALTRSRSNASHLPEAVTVVEGDVTEKESMREAMTGVDGVFHLAAWFYLGPGPREAENAERINVEGTRNVLELMAELDVPKGVYTSTLGVYPLRSFAYIDETIAPECPESAVYYRTKWEAHYEVAKPMIDDGLPLVIVQPGIVYGPGDKSHGSIRGLFRSYLQGELPMIPRGHYVPWDHVGDIADGHLRAMGQGAPGETYIISGAPRDAVDVLECAEAITGVPAPRAVSPKVFAGFASVMGAVERVITPPEGFESEGLRFFAGGRWPVDTSKATEELGITHRPLEEGLRDYLEWEMKQLKMRGDTGGEVQEVTHR
ncbi:NAD-dependent epimerase/dehydratase family protein [Natronorubrum bangense]|uniref:NAD-dependent epimerase/dehydratase n=2 Tax=Natronorubrum bangense TaxID=61858 RepID=L9WLJ8_9EURY|nr:NAD-dependent epimerase/dehydratase family protein [Natronorubrum bangense]ELY50257.1 NAD-dependent epimerase/dehydratase [Natronorubrum bangense JCM 10635]QCC54297.1 NAD-dependent epimerase/dehydratase family protein [Natronorubrum bangense]